MDLRSFSGGCLEKMHFWGMACGIAVWLVVLSDIKLKAAQLLAIKIMKVGSTISLTTLSQVSTL